MTLRREEQLSKFSGNSIIHRRYFSCKKFGVRVSGRGPIMARIVNGATPVVGQRDYWGVTTVYL